MGNTIITEDIQPIIMGVIRTITMEDTLTIITEGIQTITMEGTQTIITEVLLTIIMEAIQATMEDTQIIIIIMDILATMGTVGLFSHKFLVLDHQEVIKIRTLQLRLERNKSPFLRHVIHFYLC